MVRKTLIPWLWSHGRRMPRSPRHGASTGAVFENAPNIPFAAFVKCIYPLTAKFSRLSTPDVACPNIWVKTVAGTEASMFGIRVKIIEIKRQITLEFTFAISI